MGAIANEFTPTLSVSTNVKSDDTASSINTGELIKTCVLEAGLSATIYNAKVSLIENIESIIDQGFEGPDGKNRPLILENPKAFWDEIAKDVVDQALTSQEDNLGFLCGGRADLKVNLLLDTIRIHKPTVTCTIDEARAAIDSFEGILTGENITFNFETDSVHDILHPASTLASQIDTYVRAAQLATEAEEAKEAVQSADGPTSKKKEERESLLDASKEGKRGVVDDLDPKLPEAGLGDIVKALSQRAFARWLTGASPPKFSSVSSKFNTTEDLSSIANLVGAFRASADSFKRQSSTIADYITSLNSLKVNIKDISSKTVIPACLISETSEPNTSDLDEIIDELKTINAEVSFAENSLRTTANIIVIDWNLKNNKDLEEGDRQGESELNVVSINNDVNKIPLIISIKNEQRYVTGPQKSISPTARSLGGFFDNPFEPIGSYGSSNVVLLGEADSLTSKISSHSCVRNANADFVRARIGEFDAFNLSIIQQARIEEENNE